MTEKMLAAVFEGVGQLTLKEVDKPEMTRSDQVLLEVEAVGICGTDVHITSDPPGYIATPNTILGHEYVGVVVEKGEDVTHLALGDRVVVNPNDYCGTCFYCQRHFPNLCENIGAIGIDVDGAYAKYNVVPGKLAFKIDKSVPVEHGAFAEMLADVVNGTNKAMVQPGDNVAVIGAGPIGQLYAQMFKAAGAGKIFITDLSPYRLDYSRKMGFDLVVNPRETDLVDFVMKETDVGVDVVVDAAGSTLPFALDIVRKAGKVILFGVNTQAEAPIKQSKITMKELQVLGSWLANATFPQAVKILESRQLGLDGLISHKMPLTDIHEGLEHLANQEAMKIVVYP
jgi:2-desacetyl-2-hydroxyethyl bacteriochlorophyllide A dehydrogenase